MTIKNDPKRASRRRFMAAAAVASLTLAAPTIVRSQGRKPLKVSVGRQPWAAGNSPVTQYMIANKTFERYAADAGYDLTADYRDYPSALPMVEAFVSGNLDFGMWGNTPIVRLIGQSQPIQLISVGEGHFRFVLATRKDSPIRNLKDLKGKTVGALLGGDPYNVLSQMAALRAGQSRSARVRHHHRQHADAGPGSDDPDRMDAAVLIYPAFLKANAELGTVGIMNSFGYTESHYKGPAGEGAGILLDSVKKSPFYPDGYYLHRSFWIGSPKIVKNDPAIVTAFVLAQQDAVAKLSAMDPGRGVGTFEQVLGARSQARRQGRRGRRAVRARLVLAHRGRRAQRCSRCRSSWSRARMIPKPLAWSQVRDAFRRRAPLLRAAYDKTGRKPDAARSRHATPRTFAARRRGSCNVARAHLTRWHPFKRDAS